MLLAQRRYVGARQVGFPQDGDNVNTRSCTHGRRRQSAEAPEAPGLRIINEVRAIPQHQEYIDLLKEVRRPSTAPCAVRDLSSVNSNVHAIPQHQEYIDLLKEVRRPCSAPCAVPDLRVNSNVHAIPQHQQYIELLKEVGRPRSCAKDTLE
jgi:hypothetical protein